MMQVCTVLVLLFASVPIAFQSARNWVEFEGWQDTAGGPGLPEVERLEVVVPPPVRTHDTKTPNFLRRVSPVLLD